MKVDIKFLESKEFEIPNPWDSGRTYTVGSSNANIKRISDSVFKFTEYNFIPADSTDILDGHYTFFVNYKTFEYLVYKSSDYGGLTYTLPCEFSEFLTRESLSEFTCKRVEAVIADKLLGAYFYDKNAVNRMGVNLFSNDALPEYSGENFYGEKYYIYNDGCKKCLICDYRAYKWVDHIETYSDIELKALKLLCGYKQPNIKLSESKIKNAATKLYCKKEQIKSIKIDINGKEYTIIHQKPKFGSSNIYLMLNKIEISHDIMCNSITKFIRDIPVMLNNYATL